MANLYIGADLGTSSLKLLLVDEKGNIINTKSYSYPCECPEEGWSEQSPSLWLSAFKTGVKDLVSGINKDNIKAIGIAGQMHGLVILDKDNNVIRPAILWNDNRTEKQVNFLNKEIGKETLLEYTANVAVTGFTAPKLLWVKENEPENFKKINKVMLPKDYINFSLTGNFSCDYTDASGSLLLDVKNKCWSEQMLSICGIKKENMPKLYESYEVVGYLQENIALEIGLNKNIPVVAGAGDNAAAAVGSGTVNNLKSNISIGTSGTIFVSLENFVLSGLDTIHTFCHATGGYHLLGGIINAASCNNWFCQNILNSLDFKALQEEIANSMLGENHLFFLPYLNGERSPINDNNAKGTFIGLRSETKRKDMLLGVLEGVAFAIKDNLEIIKQKGVDIKVSGLCGGGAKSPLWQEIFCNVLNINIEIPKAEEGPGFGAAMLSMVGAKEYENIESCVNALVKVKKTLTPNNEISQKYEKQYEKFSLLYPALKNIFKVI